MADEDELTGRGIDRCADALTACLDGILQREVERGIGDRHVVKKLIAQLVLDPTVLRP